MSEFKHTTFVVDHKFDPIACRHYLNGHTAVLHCHHYSTLYSQLALDAEETEILQSAAENAIFPVLAEYFEDYGIDDLEARIELASQYYSVVGLGKMKVNFLGEYSGEVELAKSHVDEGWLKKWGKYDKPVNYITAGFIAALFAAVLDLEPGSFDVSEIESVVMGADKSLFSVVKK